MVAEGDPKSARELEVLRYLAAGLTYPGIAKWLIISVNTVPHRVKGMYSKLDVSSRAEAPTWGQMLLIVSSTKGSGPGEHELASERGCRRIHERRGLE